MRIFNFLKSMQNQRLLSFFLTKTTLEEYGLSDGLMVSASNISLKCWRTSSDKAGGILRFGSLKGVLSVSFISCLTISAFLRSVGPLEKICDQLPNTCFIFKLDQVTSHQCLQALLTVQGQYFHVALFLTSLMGQGSMNLILLHY